MSDWIFGFHAVLAELESDRAVELLWLQKGRKDRRLQRLLDIARSSGVVTKWVPRVRLDELAGEAPHNGCAARCAPVELVAPRDIVAPEGETSRLLLLDDLSDPHNLGAVIRTAAAFAIEGIVIAGPSAPPLGGAAARAAAGLMGTVPVARATVAADVLAMLRAEGYWALGADAAGAAASEVSPIDRWVLCVGSEDRGLRAKTRSQIDELVRIPMAAGVESLNLSVATGILLYHLCHVWPQSSCKFKVES
jgi:23S rRNA (guanosine2251-2'-O)-methyltransferase